MFERAAASTNIALEDAKQQFLKQAGIRRFGEAEEIADLMAFAVSPAARWMTGTVLRWTAVRSSRSDRPRIRRFAKRGGTKRGAGDLELGKTSTAQNDKLISVQSGCSHADQRASGRFE
jgi:hypothetical protein